MNDTKPQRPEECRNLYRDGLCFELAYFEGRNLCFGRCRLYDPHVCACAKFKPIKK